MKTLLTVVLMLGLSSSVMATHIPKHTPPPPCADCGVITGASGFVLGYVVATVVGAAIDQAPYNCVIKKTSPKPGTNYTNETSVCTK